MTRGIGVFLVLAALVAGCSVQGGASDPGPSANAENRAVLFRSFVEAINGGDTAAAKALFKADASWERGGQCPPGSCVGLERLGQEIDRDVANHHRLDIVSIEDVDNAARVRVELRNDGTRLAGVERTIQIFTITAASGKIASLRAVNDVTDAMTLSFVSGPRQAAPGAGGAGR